MLPTEPALLCLIGAPEALLNTDMVQTRAKLLLLLLLRRNIRAEGATVTSVGPAMPWLMKHAALTNSASLPPAAVLQPCALPTAAVGHRGRRARDAAVCACRCTCHWVVHRA